MYQRGFTIVELLITLAIFAIVATIAMPSFTAMIADNRQTATLNNFIGILQSARSEAIKRNTDVSLCKSTNGSSCAAGNNWETGWIVFVDGDASNTTIEDINGDGQIGRGIEILKVNQSMNGNVTFTSNSNIISYSSKGRINGAMTFTYCDDNSSETRAIVLRTSGRQGTSTKSHDGSALSC